MCLGALWGEHSLKVACSARAVQGFPQCACSVHAVHSCPHMLINANTYLSPSSSSFSILMLSFSVVPFTAGLDKAVLDMGLQEVANLVITEDYAYGAKGFASWGIKPHANLHFQIEILSIE